MTDRRRTDPITGEVVDDPAVQPELTGLRDVSSQEPTTLREVN